MTMQDTLVDVILIVFKRLRQSEDSFEVFKGLTDLSITSNELKNSINDEILIDLSYRYVRGRSRFVHSKLRYFIRNNDFNGFKKYADLVVKYYSPLEASRLLNNLILYTTQRSEYTFLQSYLEYLAPRHTETLIQYFEFRSKAPFAGFHPKILIKSLRTSSDNKWRQKTRLLFDTLLTYLRMPSDRSHYQPISRVKAAISQNSPLDFSSLGGMLRLFYLSPEKYRRRYRPMGDLGLGDCINNMIRHVPDPSRMLAKKELLALPLEQQPWFYGNIPMNDINNILGEPSTKNCFVVTFRGSKPYFFKEHRSKIVRREFNDANMSKLTNYGLPLKGNVLEFELYQFYRSLVDNDLEMIKNAYSRLYTEINWNILESQPHPLMEYLNEVDDIKEDIFQWLVVTLPPIAQLDWKRRDVPQKFIPALRTVIEKGAKIKTGFLLRYMAKDLPVKKSQMILLSERWTETYTNDRVFQFIFSDYPQLLKQNHVISETKLLIFSAWKYEKSSPFNLLPKELVQLIIQQVNEDSLACQFAKVIAQTGVLIAFNLTPEFFEKYSFGLEFFYEYASQFTSRALRTSTRSLCDSKYKVFKRDIKLVEQIINRASIGSEHIFASKMMRYLLKYETDETYFKGDAHLGGWARMNIFGGVWFDAGPEFVLETVRTKNKAALRFLIQQFSRAGVVQLHHLTPSEELFNEKIKPKHQITYQQAIAFITETYQENQVPLFAQ